ncbi:sialin isoform X2 [Patella vulgata]|nr:sialin isoform X2 [Patella vulgata]
MGMPGMFFILTTWGPPEEKGRLLSIIFSGNFFSNVLIFPIAGLLCSYGFAGGWPSIFYVSGIANLIWCVFWYFIVFDSPLTHPSIHPKEKEYIIASLNLTAKSSAERKSRKGAPWRHIFTSLPVISVICAQFSMNWGMYLILSSLPLYMREILKFDVKSNGLFTMLPFISMWFVLSLSGMASDWTSRRFGLAVARKSATVVGQVIPAILYIIVSYLDCESIPLVMVLLCISIGLMAANFVGPIVNFFDIAGEHVGQVMTLSNTISNIPGILTPYIVAEFTKDNTREQWQHVFFLTAGLMCFCSLVFVVFSKFTPQHWAVEITVEPEENETLNEL